MVIGGEKIMGNAKKFKCNHCSAIISMQSKPVFAAVDVITQSLLSTQFDYEKKRYFTYCKQCNNEIYFPNSLLDDEI